MSDNYHETIAELQERIATLEATLGAVRSIGNETALTDAWGITQQQASIVLALYSQGSRIFPRWHLDGIIYHRYAEYEPGSDSNLIDIAVSKIRKAVGPNVIETVNGRGFRLTENGKRLVEDLLKSVV